MAKRNLTETANRVRCTDRGGYGMSSAEIYELIEMARNVGSADAIITAFNFGYVLGHRATLAGRYKENRKTGNPYID